MIYQNFQASGHYQFTGISLNLGFSCNHIFDFVIARFFKNNGMAHENIKFK
jgi:hypothetical protein